MNTTQLGNITQRELALLVGVHPSKIANWQNLTKNPMPRDKHPALKWLVEQGLLEGTTKADIQRGVQFPEGKSGGRHWTRGDISQTDLAALLGVTQSQICKAQCCDVNPMPRNRAEALAWAKENDFGNPDVDESAFVHRSYVPKGADKTGTFRSYRYIDRDDVERMFGPDCLRHIACDTHEYRWRIHTVLHYALANNFDLVRHDADGFYEQDVHTFNRLRDEKREREIIEHDRTPEDEERAADEIFKALENVAGMVVRWRNEIKIRARAMARQDATGPDNCVVEFTPDQPPPKVKRAPKGKEIVTDFVDGKPFTETKAVAVEKKGPCPHDWLPRQRGKGVWCKLCGETRTE